MILMASFLSLTAPMCQPPRQMIDTRSPVLPSGRVGKPLEAVSSAPRAAARLRAALAASEACRNSRRLFGVSFIACLLVNAESSGAENSQPQMIFFQRREDGKQPSMKGGEIRKIERWLVPR